MKLGRPGGPPEDSITLRVVVAAAVEIAILAIVSQGAVEGLATVLPMLLAPVGYLFSYQQRYRSNITTKVLLSVGLLITFALFLQSVGNAGTVDAARVPLASLFLWVQVLHAFDVPRRRDLAFSMISSVILMAEAGSLSLDTSLVLFLFPWAVLAGAWLFLTSGPKPGSVIEPISLRRRAGTRRPGVPAGAFAGAGVAVLAMSLVAFVAMPRLPGAFVRTPPFSLSHSDPVSGFDGGVQNPVLPAQTGDGVVNFAPGAYPGFSESVDLRARGHLSNAIAFRVRAQQPSLWRAESFDSYDGTSWTIDDRTTQELVTGADPGAVGVPSRVFGQQIKLAPTVRMIQTFYIDSPQPNVVFAASVPQEIYFPASGLRVDRYGSVRSPILLDRGLVYSVVSEVPMTDPKLLRHAAPIERMQQRYLQLPAELPLRVRDLATQITAGASTEYGRVMAVQTWLQANTRYNLDAPAPPPGADAVDNFLFTTRQGFCEQIASSMAVLLRADGIPTRLVTGYGPGSRNPFTGYFEVRQSDAHAWVEVYYPSIGWVPYDPTFGVPEISSAATPRFVGGEVLAALGRFVSHVTPEPVKRLIRDAGRAAVAFERGLLAHWWLLLGLAVAFAGALRVWGRLRKRRRTSRWVGAGAAFAELTEALTSCGHARHLHETPSEYLRSVDADHRLDRAVVEGAELVVRTFERERFSGRPPSDEEVARAKEAAAGVRELVSRR